MEHYLNIAEEMYLYNGKTAKEAIDIMLKVKEMEELKCQEHQ
jgi:hypothetical protein